MLIIFIPLYRSFRLCIIYHPLQCQILLLLSVILYNMLIGTFLLELNIIQILFCDFHMHRVIIKILTLSLFRAICFSLSLPILRSIAIGLNYLYIGRFISPMFFLFNFYSPFSSQVYGLFAVLCIICCVYLQTIFC